MDYYFGKILGAVVSPGNLLCLLLFVAAIMAGSRQKKIRSLGADACFAIAFLLMLIAILPVGEWALTPLENRFRPTVPDRVDGILILGGDEDPYTTEARNLPTLLHSTHRYVVAANLARRYPAAKVVFTGGYPGKLPKGGTTNATVAKGILTELGLPLERVFFEDLSRTTYENARDSYAQITPQPEEKWILVTSAFHMPRSMGAFRKAGWNVYPMPTDYLTTGHYPFYVEFRLVAHLSMLQTAFHEYAGLIGYWCQGKVAKLWPE